MTNLFYSQTSGKMTKEDGTLVATGWAGNDKRPDVNPNNIHGKNNPEAQNIRCIGPLPQGTYSVGSWGTHSVGPNSAPLTQTSGETFGRSAFYIHGPGTTTYGEDSEGCIVIPRTDRMKVIALNPTQLTVTV